MTDEGEYQRSQKKKKKELDEEVIEMKEVKAVEERDLCGDQQAESLEETNPKGSLMSKSVTILQGRMLI